MEQSSLEQLSFDLFDSIYGPEDLGECKLSRIEIISINFFFVLVLVDFSILFPKDATTSPRNPTLRSPLEIQEQSYILGGELPELSSDELATFLAVDTIFDFSQLSGSLDSDKSTGNSKFSLKSDDIFTGSLSSLEVLLFNDTEKDPLLLEDAQTIPDPLAVEEEEELFIVVDEPRQKISINDLSLCEQPQQSPGCKRKQNVAAIRQSRMPFNEDTPRPQTRRGNSGSTTRRHLTYQEEYLRLTGIADAENVPVPNESNRCPGCNKIFKRLSQHKCKMLTRTVSDPLPSASLNNHLKYKCKFCKRTFRTEAAFQNHLNSHIEGNVLVSQATDSIEKK